MVVAAISAGAALTLMGTVVIPLVTSHLNAQLENKNMLIESQQKNISNVETQLKSVEARLEASIKEVTQKNEEKETLHKEIRRIQLETPFLPPTPYPKGLDTMRVGDDVEQANDLYPSTAIDKSRDTYWSIKTKHAIFDQVTYYFDEKDKKISHILFHRAYDGPIKEEEVFTLVSNAFGKPVISYQGNHIWSSRTNENIAIEEDGGFLIYGKGVHPRWLIKGIDSGKILVPQSKGGQMCSRPSEKGETPKAKAKS